MTEEMNLTVEKTKPGAARITATIPRLSPDKVFFLDFNLNNEFGFSRGLEMLRNDFNAERGTLSLVELGEIIDEFELRAHTAYLGITT